MEIRKLQKGDPRRSFRSGVATLDEYLSRYADKNQFRLHVGVTYVAIEDSPILGYATVTMSSLDAEKLPGRGYPRYPIPVLLVARLATDVSARGRGVGVALLAKCGKMGLALRDEVGCIGLVTDAKDEDAVSFYAHHRFIVLDSPAAEGRTTLMFCPLGVFE